MRAGEWGRARELVAAGLAELPGSPVLLYNLACCEARLGRREEALGHLRAAIETDPSLAANAVGDEDLASIRDDASFPAGRDRGHP
jgi:tetratricopeptide (TPR) repeat protein